MNRSIQIRLVIPSKASICSPRARTLLVLGLDQETWAREHELIHGVPLQFPSLPLITPAQFDINIKSVYTFYQRLTHVHMLMVSSIPRAPTLYTLICDNESNYLLDWV